MEDWSTRICSTVDLRQLDSLDSPFHQHLMTSLDQLTEELREVVRQCEGGGGGGSDIEDMVMGGQISEKHSDVISGLRTFLSSVEGQSVALDRELGDLEGRKADLLEERDVLIEKGHELNCRIGYNALERKLEETFTDTEKYTSLEGATCFRDEAEEKLRRTHDMIRIGNMRACQIDRDLYNEMERITDLFENYERDRELYVKELDLFCHVRRLRIQAWLQETRSDGERELGEDMLDFLSLSEKERHMKAQVIRNALRMYSFNASLTFDREDNRKLMDELTELQAKVNAASGLSVLVPRHALASTDLTSQTLGMGDSSMDDGDEEEEENGGCDVSDKSDTEEEVTSRRSEHSLSGRGLHRCPRRMHLAVQPVTEPELLDKLNAALRWEEQDGEATTESPAPEPEVVEEAAAAEELSPSLGGPPGDSEDTSIASASEIEVKMPAKDPPVCGGVSGDSVQRKDGRKPGNGHGPPFLVSDLVNPAAHNAADSCPGPVDRHYSGILRKKKSSLTSLSNVSWETAASCHRIPAVDSQERLTRVTSQTSEPTITGGRHHVTNMAAGNKARDNVPPRDKE